MDAKELMIGNYLSIQGEGWFKIGVSDIDSIERGDAAGILWEGIPMSDDWVNRKDGLLRKDGIYSWQFGDVEKETIQVFQIQMINGRWKFRVSHTGIWISDRLDYLHQLQNLFKANTGEELTISPPSK